MRNEVQRKCANRKWQREGGRQNHPNHRNRQRNKSGNEGGSHKPNRKPRQNQEEKNFHGETTKMNGHVFQTHAERSNKNQFIDNVEVLRVYCSTAYKSDIEALAPLFKSLKKPSVKKPADPIMMITKGEDSNDIETISKFEEMKYTELIKQWIRDDRSLEATTRSLYNIVWGQCSKQVRNKVKMSNIFEKIKEKGDATSLLKEIRSVMLQIETNTSIYDATDKAKSIIYTYKQEEHESNAKHVKNLSSIIEAVSYIGGSIFEDKGLIDHEREKDENNLLAKTRSEEDLKKDVKDKTMGLMLIKRANKAKYGGLLTTIRDHTLSMM